MCRVGWESITGRTLVVVYRRRFTPFLLVSLFRARTGDDILDFSGLLIALATLDALCWIKSVMVSLMVSMTSSFYSVLNRFLNANCN